MAHIVGYPRIGPKRELKFALESFWDKKSNEGELEKVAAGLRKAMWHQLSAAGVTLIPSNTFSYYDQVLDTIAMVGAVPKRYGWDGGKVNLDIYFAMARGTATEPAMEMTKWFDTNYHFIVPELLPEMDFALSSDKAAKEYVEALNEGVETVPVLVGPVTFLMLSKPAAGADAAFDKFTLLPKLLKVYKEVLIHLRDAGAKWIQLDEPALVLDLDAAAFEAYKSAYAVLGNIFQNPSCRLIVETYFEELSAEAYQCVTQLGGVSAIGVDLVRGQNTLALVREHGLPAHLTLLAGLVDGRNVWINDLASSLHLLHELQSLLGPGRVIVSTSCSLQHTAVDLDLETMVDAEPKRWMAFAVQKVNEVVALSRALAGHKDEATFASNAAALAMRSSSMHVTNHKVRKQVELFCNQAVSRKTPVMERLAKQQEHLHLPFLPTTTIGSFPQTADIRSIRREFRAGKLSVFEYEEGIRKEIAHVVKLQEEIGLDVLVHGECERTDMVEYFGEQLQGFAFTRNGWVQSYGSRCVKPPVIYGDVSRPTPMTVSWIKFAQSLTPKPVKGMLTGPVTILNWSFVRDDQPRHETCMQIALAMRDEVLGLESAGVSIIQIDEAALREGLPLKKSQRQFYLEWAVRAFRITCSGIDDVTQIHTHMCYSNFNDIMDAIVAMDADVITIENSRSDERLLSAFRKGGLKYVAGIGPGVYDIHSPRIPDAEELADRLRNILSVLNAEVVWVNPDCGLKTRKYKEVEPALKNMVIAAQIVRAEVASAV